jgi:hypothetical protein
VIIEAVKIIDAALRDATIGLAAQLALVPREGGDSAPATPTIYNEVNSGIASRETFPDGNGPFLLITSSSSESRNPAVRPVTDLSVDVLIRYGVRNGTTEAAVRAASYSLRATVRTLGLLVTQADSLCGRNQVQLLEVNNVRYMLLSAPVDDTLVTWGLTCTCRMRDLWANA